jgi:hypothetical protein
MTDDRTRQDLINALESHQKQFDHLALYVTRDPCAVTRSAIFELFLTLKRLNLLEVKLKVNDVNFSCQKEVIWQPLEQRLLVQWQVLNELNEGQLKMLFEHKSKDVRKATYEALIEDEGRRRHPLDDFDLRQFLRNETDPSCLEALVRLLLLYSPKRHSGQQLFPR